ncbi:AAT family amino acid transporter [Elsinoe ampelina]|uniref:AAT family amino acid transporter n=1 Tax=Elsinoe ampelina TaxID=302913 RepID=A0A6A6GK85_9PEZI|nr:AAT family amino acid transporter [Elsinoe ampelina]
MTALDSSADGHTGEKTGMKTTNDDLSRLGSRRQGEILDVHGLHGTKRNIKSRHAQMIAIGGTIGTGLFVGSGQALAIGGPAFLLIAYCLTSFLVYGVVTAVAEVGTYLPVQGSSTAYFCSRFVSRSLGFALGWLYFYSFGILVAYEITAANIVINYWPNSIHPAVWITLMLIVIVGLNFCPVGIYAETEFWFAGVKVAMIIGLLLLSLILMLGGGPTGDRLGFRYWNNPGAVKAYLVPGDGGRFTAFLYVWIFSGFSFYFGPELIIYTAGEMRNPRKNLPTAARRFFYRLIVFYVLGALAIGVICNSDAEGLTTGAGNANASPWVIAIKNASIPVLPSIINAGILVSAWSAGNAFLYMSSRSLYSLAISGHAPRIFTRCTRYGLPIYAVGASSLFGGLAYLSVGTQAGQVFNYFISLTNTAGFTSWLVCCITFVRFRKACVTQGVVSPFRSRVQPIAAWVCIFLFAFFLLLNGFTVFYPGNFTVAGFLTTYLGIPIFIILWLGHRFIAARDDPWVIAPGSVDLVSGLAEVEDDAQMFAELEERQKSQSSGLLGKVLHKISVIWS